MARPADSLYAEDPLAMLRRKEVSVEDNAEAEIRRAQREIKRDILELTRETNVGGSADAREKVFDAVTKRINGLEKRLDRLERAALEYAARDGVKAGNAATGAEVKYSKERADTYISTLAGDDTGKSLAAVFTRNMGENVILSLRNATVAAMRENAVAGGTTKDLARRLEEKWMSTAKDGGIYQFVDSAGRIWNTKTYIAMQVRTNAMRVYNDSKIETIAQATGGDLVRISTGGDADCRECFPWEGRIVSITGKTPDFPTYEQAREAGCFHPNCTHTIEYVDPLLDKAEIDLQKKYPIEDIENKTNEELDENRYQIDQARYREQGFSAEDARLAVDRDNLVDSMRYGLVREDAAQLVEGMNAAQITALCPNGNPPQFEPTKKATRANPNADKERWDRGKRGGVVHISRDTSLENLLKVCGVADLKGPAVALPEPVPPTEAAKKEAARDFDKEATRRLGLEDALKAVDAITPHIENEKMPQGYESLERRQKRARDVYKKRYEAVKAINRRIDTLTTQLFRARWDDTPSAELGQLESKLAQVKEERRRAAEKANRAWTRSHDLYQRLETMRNEASAAVVSKLAHGGASPTIREAKVTKGVAATWAESKKLIESLVAADVWPDKAIQVLSLRKNARAYQRGDSINVATNGKAAIFVHESMHFIEEWADHVHKRCVEFLEYRTQGEETRSLRALTGCRGYDSWEVAKKDKFFDAYCGKIYRDRRNPDRLTATEILSMGVQRLVEDPISFFQKDREYATFCLNLIRGNL